MNLWLFSGNSCHFRYLYFVDDMFFSTWYRLRVDVECDMEVVRGWMVGSHFILSKKVSHCVAYLYIITWNICICLDLHNCPCKLCMCNVVCCEKLYRCNSHTHVDILVLLNKGWALCTWHAGVVTIIAKPVT